jgi:hypothetical protein
LPYNTYNAGGYWVIPDSEKKLKKISDPVQLLCHALPFRLLGVFNELADFNATGVPTW